MGTVPMYHLQTRLTAGVMLGLPKMLSSSWGEESCDEVSLQSFFEDERRYIPTYSAFLSECFILDCLSGPGKGHPQVLSSLTIKGLTVTHLKMPAMRKGSS